ncbi:MAG: FAD-dependent oxidoreductase, partial [Myxococcota bacterium]
MLIVGGGISGAAVARDAALRGIPCVLVERGDFACGTSSFTSKLVHGGLRYLARMDLRTTRTSSVERDRLRRLDPNLLVEIPFLVCARRSPNGVAPWKLRAALGLYSSLGRSGRRAGMLRRRSWATRVPDLDVDTISGVGLYRELQVDDARLVLEIIKDARRAGAVALNYTELVHFRHCDRGRILGAVVRDQRSQRCFFIRTDTVVNTTGTNVDRVRQLAGRVGGRVRPARGTHLVIGRHHLAVDAAVAFQARDGRNLFVCPYEEVFIIGTTDEFAEERDSPVPTEAEQNYLLGEMNSMFPKLNLGPSDVLSAWAGV